MLFIFWKNSLMLSITLTLKVLFTGTSNRQILWSDNSLILIPNKEYFSLLLLTLGMLKGFMPGGNLKCFIMLGRLLIWLLNLINRRITHKKVISGHWELYFLKFSLEIHLIQMLKLKNFSDNQLSTFKKYWLKKIIVFQQGV